MEQVQVSLKEWYLAKADERYLGETFAVQPILLNKFAAKFVRGATLTD